MKKIGLISLSLLALFCIVSFAGCGLISGTRKKTQTPLVISQVAGKTYGMPSFSLSATGGSGHGEITWIQTRGASVATISSAGLVQITGVGDIAVIATKAEDENYKAVTSSEYTITIGKGTVLVPTLATVQYSPTQKLSSITLPSGWTWDDNQITPTPSVSTYKASFAGDEYYNPASSVNVSMLVNKLNQPTALSIEGSDPIVKTLSPTSEENKLQLAASGGDGTGAITFKRLDGSQGGTANAQVTEDGLVTYTTAGTIFVRAIKSGDEFYTAKASAQPKEIRVQTKLVAPTNLEINGTVLTWDSVTDATSYSVIIRSSNGTTSDNASANTLDIAARLQADGSYYISVMALGDNITRLASNPSMEYEWVKNSSNANLSSLLVGGYALEPVFSPNITDYTLSIPYQSEGTVTVTATPTKAASLATFASDNITTAQVSASSRSAFIRVKVVAEDGTTTKTYTINVTMQAPSTDARLTDLTVSFGALTPEFNQLQTSYSISVPFQSTGNKTVTAIPVLPANAKLDYSDSATILTVDVSANARSAVIRIKVLAQDNATSLTYTITVNMLPDTNSKLSGLTLSARDEDSNPVSFTQTPTSFDPDTLIYEITVEHQISGNILVNALPLTSETATVNEDESILSVAINKNSPTAILEIVVVAENGSTTTYQITVIMLMP